MSLRWSLPTLAFSMLASLSVSAETTPLLIHSSQSFATVARAIQSQEETPRSDRTVPDLFQQSPITRPPKPLFPPPPTTPAPTSPVLSLPELEQAVYEQVNQHRLKLGLRPLQLDTRVSAQARAHSQAMANKDVPFGHYNFKRRVQRVDRIISSRRIAENVAYIFSHNQPAKRAVDGWLRSSHHRPEVEGNYSVTGVGVAMGDRGALFFTQIYVRPR